MAQPHRYRSTRALAEDVVDGELEIGKSGRGQAVTAPPGLGDPVAGRGRLAVDQDEPAGKVHDPHFGHAVAVVERQLDLLIVSQGGVGDFHEQQHIRGGGGAGGVEVQIGRASCRERV